MPLTIVEIIKQAEQGMSSPFLCRADDGALYFVKGRASGRASLWADNAPSEWQWENDEQDLPARFAPVAAKTLAARCTHPDFWRTP